MFYEDSTDVRNEERSGHPSLITEDLKNRTNRRFTLDEIHETFPQISLSLIHEIFTEYLHGVSPLPKKKNVQSGWVPRMLTEERKSKRVVAALTFLERYHKESDNFFGPDARSLRR
jgi:hypothetical protein